MSAELLNQALPQCRLKTVRVGGAHGAFKLTEIEHVATRFAPHFYTTYSVGIVESGRCCLMTPHGSWVAEPGSLLAFAPEELHWAHVISEEPYAYRMAYLSSECVRELGLRATNGVAGTRGNLVPVTGPSALSPEFLKAHRNVIDDPGGSTAVSELLRSTRAIFQAAAGLPSRQCTTKDTTLVETAKEFLAAHVGRRVSLDGVAEMCGVTAFQLIRVFRRVTGLSPYAYLIVLRVNEARRMLDAGASVSDAVYACCFSDQSHLTRTFKRTLGMPPGLYLRSTR